LIHALPRMSPGQRETVARLMASAEPTDEQIHAVIEVVTNCGGLEYARGRAQGFMEAAEADLERLEPGPARETLRSSLGYVLDRRR
jgi:geranylgeranyl pyrophosphate synthase